MKSDNLQVIQSYILTTSRYDFSVYQKRIMYLLVKIAQADLNGKKLDKNYLIGETLFGDKKISMRYSDLMEEDHRNYKRIKDALWSLNDKKFEYHDRASGWESLHRLIDKPKINKETKALEFQVDDIVWKVILDISAKGWRKYEIDRAMSFESVYAMRFYELVSGTLDGYIQQFTIEALKEMFHLVGRYKQINDFLKRVVIPAKTELDAKSPYSFNYKMIKAKGSRKYTSILFTTIIIPENQNQEVEKKALQKETSSSHFLDKELRRYLMDKYAFDEKGLRSNIELIESSLKAFDLRKFLSVQLRTAETTAKNKTAWIIGAMRKHLKAIDDKKTSKKSDDLINDLGNSLTSD